MLRTFQVQLQGDVCRRVSAIQLQVQLHCDVCRRVSGDANSPNENGHPVNGPSVKQEVGEDVGSDIEMLEHVKPVIKPDPGAEMAAEEVIMDDAIVKPEAHAVLDDAMEEDEPNGGAEDQAGPSGEVAAVPNIKGDDDETDSDAEVDRDDDDFDDAVGAQAGVLVDGVDSDDVRLTIKALPPQELVACAEVKLPEDAAAADAYVERALVGISHVLSDVPKVCMSMADSIKPANPYAPTSHLWHGVCIERAQRRELISAACRYGENDIAGNYNKKRRDSSFMSMVLYKHLDFELFQRTKHMDAEEAAAHKEKTLQTAKEAMHKAFGFRKVQKGLAFKAMMQKAMPVERWTHTEEKHVSGKDEPVTLCASYPRSSPACE